MIRAEPLIESFGFILVRMCCFLSYEDLLKLAAVNRAFRTLIFKQASRENHTDDSPIDFHTVLWSQLCLRESVFCEPGLKQSTHEDHASLKDHYDRNCVSFYLVELSAPGARQEFHICKDRAAVRETLIEQFRVDESRLFIQHLCRLGLDILVYVCYQGRLINVTYMYDHMTLRIGTSSYLGFKYLGGIGSCHSQSGSSAQSQTSQEQLYLASNSRGDRVWRGAPTVARSVEPPTMPPSCRAVHTFYRGGRVSRYQITHYRDEESATDVSGPEGPAIGVECPPGLFCDILFLDIYPHFDVSVLPDLHASAVPPRYLEAACLGDSDFGVRVPIKPRAIGAHPPTFDLVVPAQAPRQGRGRGRSRCAAFPASTVIALSDPHLECDRDVLIADSESGIMSQTASSDSVGDTLNRGDLRIYGRGQGFRNFTLRLGKNEMDPAALAEAQDGPFVAPVVLMY